MIYVRENVKKRHLCWFFQHLKKLFCETNFYVSASKFALRKSSLDDYKSDLVARIVKLIVWNAIDIDKVVFQNCVAVKKQGVFQIYWPIFDQSSLGL